jgi:hypothetical protein
MEQRSQLELRKWFVGLKPLRQLKRIIANKNRKWENVAKSFLKTTHFDEVNKMMHLHEMEMWSINA